MVHEMHGCQCMILKEINIMLESVIICLIVGNFINTSTLNELCEKKLPFIENLRVKYLSCFKH